MSKVEFLHLLEAILERDPDSISGEATLEAIGWDSMAAVSFLALADEHGVQVSAHKLSECKTVPDLALLMGDKIS